MTEADFHLSGEEVDYTAIGSKEGNARKPIFEFFNSGRGSWLGARAVDVHFLLWRWFHPDARFADYYAGSVRASLRRGATHKTLGNKIFLSGSILSKAEMIDPKAFQRRGRRLFDLIVKSGLSPHHRCIDYGCGSLRIGQHLISFLDSDRYLGLDVVSDFYDAGLPLLPPEALLLKRPRFHPINENTIDSVSREMPDFIVSISVLKHVPPKEANLYFSNVAKLMGRNGVALITFNEGERTGRTGAKIWDYSRSDVLALVGAYLPGVICSFSPVKGNSTSLALPRHTVMYVSSTR